MKNLSKFFWTGNYAGNARCPITRPLTCAVDIVDWQEMMHYIDDALGVCAGLSSFPLKPPYHIHNYPKFISAGDGNRYG